MNSLNLFIPGKKATVPVYIGRGILNSMDSIVPLKKYSSLLVIMDENVAQYWHDKIDESIGKNAFYFTIPAGEENKTLATVQKIWKILSTKGFDRKSLIVNMGGGMVCDVGAFAASTYMRGIDFIQVPTTLLAQADAAIGGKTGFNFNGLKNTIGTFSAPAAVFNDTLFLSTLPERELNSGFAEIIKHAIITGGDLLEFLCRKKLTSLTAKEIDKIVYSSAHIKCEIVRKDPYEKSERKKLNFGHTVGHAIEMACQDSSESLLHGEAIAIGMLAEARMSFLAGFLSAQKFKKIETLILKAGLPCKLSAKYKKNIKKKMLSDKKNVNGQIKWIFLEDVGNARVDVILPPKLISAGLDYVLK